jgi:hypothetical protein
VKSCGPIPAKSLPYPVIQDRKSGQEVAKQIY